MGDSQVDKSVLHQIRQVSATDRGPVLKAAVANPFAIHLVRNPSFKRLHGVISDEFRNGADVAHPGRRRVSWNLKGSRRAARDPRPDLTE